MKTKLTLVLADKPVKIDLDKFTSDRAYALFDKVADIRIKHSPHAKFPREEEETEEAWKDRIRKETEKDSVRHEGESNNQFLKRIFDAKHEMYNLAFDILNAICEVFDAEAVTEERFKTSNWLATKKFIYDILSLGDIPASDFYVSDLN